jgi:hypothetical protein
MSVMGRPCTTCSHPERYEIDRALVEFVPYRKLSARYGISAASLSRHRKGHLPAHLARSLEAQEARRFAKLGAHQAARAEDNSRQALDVVQQLKIINSACLEVLKNAREAKRDGTLLQAVDRIHRQIELQARLLGDLESGPQVNVLLAPEWTEVRQAVFVALAPHPEARAAVAEALKALPAIEA